MKKINDKTGDTDVSTENKQKRVSLTKRIVLLGIPFILFIVGVAMMSVFLFKTYFENSVYFNLMINSSSGVNVRKTQDAAPELNVTREEITPSVYTFTVPVTEPDTTVSDQTVTTATGTATVTETPGTETNASEVAPTVTKKQKPEKTEYEVVQYHNYDEFPPIPWGDCWGKMTISSIGLRGAPMYNGDDTQILSYTHSKAIGKKYGSQFPGQGGVTILCSHVTRAFYGLEDVKKGDKVTLNTFYGKYVYEVVEKRIFGANDTSILHEKFDYEALLCYTCYPRGRSVRTQRIAIICKKVSGMDWIKVGAEK